jgi:hypothetical protein
MSSVNPARALARRGFDEEDVAGTPAGAYRFA